MEQLKLVLGNAAEFDKLVFGRDGKHTLKQASNITLCTKDNGTTNGRPVVVIAFDAQLPDGSVVRAQAVTTVRLLVGFYSAMRGRYGPGGPESHRLPGSESPFIH